MLGAVALSLMMGGWLSVHGLPPDPVQEVIFGGTTVKSTDEVATFAVGLWITTSQGSSSCTGSLIDPEIIMTAAHCLLDSPTSITAVFTRSFGDWSSTVEVIDYRIPKDYHTEDDFPFDIALLKLATPAPRSHGPVRLASPKLPLELLQGVLVAGYGVESHLWEGDRYLGNENGDLRTAGVISTNRQRNGQLEMATTKGTGTCSGDSGGPVFVRDTKGAIVIANTVAGGGNVDSCKGTSYSLKVGDWIPWINLQMRALVGRTPQVADCASCRAPAADAAPLDEAIQARTFRAQARLGDGAYLVTLSNSTAEALKCRVSVFSPQGETLQGLAVLAAFGDGTLRLGPSLGSNVTYIVTCT